MSTVKNKNEMFVLQRTHYLYSIPEHTDNKMKF